jgi:predicted phage terminase large subunit-like protein
VKPPRAPLGRTLYDVPGVGPVCELDVVRGEQAQGRPGLTLAEFVSAAWPILEPQTPLLWNWHLDVICQHVAALVLDRPGPGGPCPQNLLVNVPPGSMKSLIVAVFLPAWVWLWRPSWRALYASGTPAVVTRDSLRTRNLVRSDWYQETFKPKWQIAKDQDEKTWFATSAGGFRRGTGAGGSVTGDRADFLGVDDPNDAAAVHGKAHRVQLNENWWDAAFSNRVASPEKSKRTLIMQRLHEEDLAGYVLRREPDAWAHLCLRQEAETPALPPTWLGWQDKRAAGDLLFPERFTPHVLEEEKKKGSSYYAGQHQQRPVSASGNRFQRSWWRFWSATGAPAPRPRGCSEAPALRFNPAVDRVDELLGSWDCTFKDTDGTDFVVGLAIARVGASKFVLALDRKRRGFQETVGAVKALRSAWPAMYRILIEDKANGSAVVETLGASVSGVVAVEPRGGKEARAAAIEAQVEAGNVLLPEGADWLDAWVEEFASFPRGAHDDQVDALSQALIEWQLGDNEGASARALLGM